MKKIESVLLNNIISVFATKAGIIILAFLNTIIIARGLGVENRGYLAALLVFSQLAIPFFEGGMRQSATLFLGRDKNPSNVISCLIIFGLISCLLAFTSSLTYLIFSFEDITILIGISLSFYLAGEVIASLIRGAALGSENFKSFNKILIYPKLINLLILIFFFIIDRFSISIVILSLVLSTTITILLYFINISKSKFTFAFDTNTFLSMIKKGFSYGVAFLVIVANYKIDILMLSKLSTTIELGLYSIAVQFGELLWQLPSAVVIVMLSRVANKASYSDIKNDVLINTFYTFWITLLGSILMFLIGGKFITISFGTDFIGSYKILNILLPGMVLMVLFKMANSYYAGDGKPMLCLYFMIPSLILNIFLNYFLIPSYGSHGAAISSTISYTFASLTMWIYFCFSNKFPIFSFLIRFKK